MADDQFIMLDVVLFLGYGEGTNYPQHHIALFTRELLTDTKCNFYVPALHMIPKYDGSCTHAE
jgi:hypothetical protein